MNTVSNNAARESAAAFRPGLDRPKVTFLSKAALEEIIDRVGYVEVKECWPPLQDHKFYERSSGNRIKSNTRQWLEDTFVCTRKRVPSNSLYVDSYIVKYWMG